MGRKIFFIAIGSFLLSLTVAGCVASTSTKGTRYQRLQAEDPDVRAQAIIEAGEKKDRKAVPLLVGRLDDNNSEVRMFAGMALKRILGDKIYNANGWKFYLSPQERQKGVENWNKWVRENMAPENGKGMWNTASSKLSPATKPSATSQKTDEQK